MRISDWSSDVCSSDLPVFRLSAQQAARLSREVRQHRAVRVRHQARPVDGNAELRDARRLFGEPGADRRVEILARKTGEEAKAHLLKIARQKTGRTSCRERVGHEG